MTPKIFLHLPRKPKPNNLPHTPPLFPQTELTHFPKKGYLDLVVVVIPPILRKSPFSTIPTTTTPINFLPGASSLDWVHLVPKMPQKLYHQIFQALLQNVVPPP